MKCKKAKLEKIVALAMVLSFSLWAIAPALATGTNINTGFTRFNSSGENGVMNPIVKVKWEARGDGEGARYLDDNLQLAGAQFMPTGQFGVSKKISICAIATDPNTNRPDTLSGVYADVYYPTGAALGPSHTWLPEQDKNDGCGKRVQEDQLIKLGKDEGIDLFCNKVKNLNNNLPTFNKGYTYDEICKADGELHEEKAAVFCAVKDLSYEDPNGDYKVTVVAKKAPFSNVGTLDNMFTYLPLTAFETDFSAINYGTVMEKVDQKTDGNLIWGDSIPTVRNVGNTRLGLSIIQDDMGLGKTGGISNVHYDARVGNNAADWAHYDPFALMPLMKQLNLSEMNKMDFSILVDKFELPMKDSYTGTMTLSATQIAHLPCE